MSWGVHSRAVLFIHVSSSFVKFPANVTKLLLKVKSNLYFLFLPSYPAFIYTKYPRRIHLRDCFLEKCFLTSTVLHEERGSDFRCDLSCFLFFFFFYNLECFYDPEVLGILEEGNTLIRTCEIMYN